MVYMMLFLYYPMIMEKWIYRYQQRALESEDFILTSLGLHESMNPAIVNRPDGTEDYLLMLFYDPVEIDLFSGNRKNCKPPSVMLWAPNSKQCYGNSECSWDHSWIHCHGAFITHVIEENKLVPGRPYRLQDPSIIEKNLRRIYEELSMNGSTSLTLCRNHFENMFIELGRDVNGTDERVIPPALLRVKRDIMENLTGHHSLTTLAMSAGLSVPHFCSEWKKHFQTSPVNYLIELRMHHAVFLLRNRNLTITQVAEQSGYGDIYSFSKQFKNHYGVSPRNLRK